LEPCKIIRWKERDAVRLTNGTVELTALNGGGHLAEFRFSGRNGFCSQNVLWEAPWSTVDPTPGWSPDKSRLYGPPETGKFLAGFTGHALCLDYFGEAPPRKALAGLGLHGEAANAQWFVLGPPESATARCAWRVDLPVSGLALKREIWLEQGESVAYVQETATNRGDVEYSCDWVEHVTFGPRFLDGNSAIFASAESGMTSPLGYEDNSLFANDLYFQWPFVQKSADNKPADLRVPFAEKGKGFLAGVRMEPSREIEFLAAVNWALRLGVGYCFRRCDFPWMALWEENCVRQKPPWNGVTQARGMEFGTTPLPLPANHGPIDKHFADTSMGCRIAAHGKRTVRYIMFLFTPPQQMRSIGNVVCGSGFVHIKDESGTTVLSLSAKRCEAFLS
jgi:hypothetical protein